MTPIQEMQAAVERLNACFDRMDANRKTIIDSLSGVSSSIDETLKSIEDWARDERLARDPDWQDYVNRMCAGEAS